MAHIRFIQATDFDQWFTLWQAYQHFYQTTIDEEITQNTFARFLDDREPIYMHLYLKMNLSNSSG